MAFPIFSSPLATLIETDSNPHSINLPALIANGSLILIWSALNDSVDITEPAGFTELKDEAIGASNARSGIFAKVADGSEGGTSISAALSADSAGVWYVAIVGGWFGSLAGVEVSLVASSIDTTLDANAVSPSWGAGLDTLYIFTAHMRKGGHSTTYPTGFVSNQANATTVLGSGGASLSIATQESTAASVDPDPVTVSAATSSGAYVLAIRPAVPTTVTIGTVSSSGGAAFRSGDSVTFNLTNANPTGKTVSIPQGALTVTAQDANSITVTVPDLKTFGDQTGRYDVATIFTVTDGAESDTQPLVISPSDGHYHSVVTDASAYDDLGQTNIVAGDRVYAQWVSGSGDVDLAVGAVSSLDEGVLRIWIQDSTDDVWGTSADIQMPHVPSWSDWGLVNYEPFSANSVSIDGIVTARTTATVSFSYPDVDVTSFEYSLDGGAWASATSPLSITGLTAETTYSLSIRPLLDGSPGSAETTSFTTDAAIDTVPNPISDQTIVGAALNSTVVFNVFTVSGVDAGVDIPLSLTNGEFRFSVNGGSTWSDWQSASGNVRLNYQIEARHIASENHSATVTTVLNIGGEVVRLSSTTVADTTAPVITLNTSSPYEVVQGSLWADPMATVTDNVDATRQIAADQLVDTSSVGTSVIDYNAIDSAGNVAQTVQLTVNVVAAAPPTSYSYSNDAQSLVVDRNGVPQTVSYDFGEVWTAAPEEGGSVVYRFGGFSVANGLFTLSSTIVQPNTTYVFIGRNSGNVPDSYMRTEVQFT